MEITYKEDYKIVVPQQSKYPSWDLYVRSVVTQEVYDRTAKGAEKSGNKIHIKVGDESWSEEGYFTNLDSLLNKIMRLEAEKKNDTSTLSDYLVLYYDIMKNFREHVTEIKKEE